MLNNLMYLFILNLTLQYPFAHKHKLVTRWCRHILQICESFLQKDSSIYTFLQTVPDIHPDAKAYAEMNKNGLSVVPEVKKIIDDTKRKKAEIISLELSSLKIIKFTLDLKKLLEELYNLQVLVLTDCSLISLENFPNLQDLQRIDLTGNHIPDPQIKHLRRYKKLKIVNLGSNELTVKCLDQLQQLKELQQLQLYENTICEEAEYRQLVFQSIKSLKILDGEDRYGLIIESEEDYDEDQVEQRNAAQEEGSDEDWENEHEENNDQEHPQQHDFQDEDVNQGQKTAPQKPAPAAPAKSGRRGRPRKNINIPKN